VRPATQTVEDVVDDAGHVVEKRRLRFERVLDAGTAFLATSLLEGVAERGTARGLRAGGIRGPIAAKTGTTDEERDLWFAGFTPDLVAVVWVGFDTPRGLGIPAAVGALPIWRSFIEGATGGVVRGSFPRPPDVEEAAIDPMTGALAMSGCPERRQEFFLAGTLPRQVCPSDATREGLLDWLRQRL
jgi:penicillin-binding protein 1B